MEFAFFTHQTVRLLLPFAYQVNPHFVNSIEMSKTNDITKAGIYIQKEHKKIISFFFWKGLVIILVWTEEIDFMHFLFTNITNSRLFLFFRDHTDIIKKWKLKIF